MLHVFGNALAEEIWHKRRSNLADRLGEEFDGSNPEKLAMLEDKYYQRLGAHLARIPKGRKGYNGRVERGYRSDDENSIFPSCSVFRMSKNCSIRQLVGNTSLIW